jgi:eukaryotic-like serine/threonine-protein kinase
MSRVFTARETALGRQVVVKVLPPDLAAGVSTERFKREIAVAARLQHPHIVPLLSAGEMDGIPYFTMPFIAGESLRVRLASGELPVTESVRVLREIASALAYAHEHGVVHRDIKPDNILFAGDVAMVADFGVAKALSASTHGDPGTATGSVTSAGIALGTPAYMAPEQATADPGADHRADLYAFGVVAYEMLTGRPPFADRPAARLLAAHVAEMPEPISRRRPQLPPALAALVMRCLEKRPADRPQSASEVVQALDAITTPSGGTVPTAAAPAAGTRPAAPVAARPRGAPWMAVAVAAVAIVAVAIFLWRRSPPATVAASDARDHRIAVLPFENLGDSADAYFADGMTDAVRGKLTTLTDLEVIARSSSAQYAPRRNVPDRDAARELGVRYLLKGTVRWAKVSGRSSRVLVTPELVEVASDGAPASRWQQPFDAELADVFRVQGEIAGNVAQAMRVALGGAERQRLAAVSTTNPAAYDAFLRGEAIAANGGAISAELRRAIPHYERAVRLDSTFADAWAYLSIALSIIYANGVPSADLDREARTAADRAVQLAPHSGTAHRALGTYYRVVRFDNRRALEEFQIAAAAAPRDPLVLSALGVGRLSLGQVEEAVRDLEAAQRLDPRSPVALLTLALGQLWRREPAAARTTADRLLSLAPGNPQYIRVRVMAALAAGDLADARAVLQAAARQTDVDALGVHLASAWGLGWALDDALQRRVLAAGVERYDGDRGGMAFVRMQLHGWRGDSVAMHAWADTAFRELDAQVRAMPNDAQRRANRGVALAYLGRTEEAIADGERAVAMLPIEQDAIAGPHQVQLLARIHLVSGEPDKAVDLLGQILARPYYVTPAWLRIDPTFAALRGNVQFERLTASIR